MEKIDDKACAITKRKPESNCCALGLVDHGLPGRWLLLLVESVPEMIYHYL